MNRKYKIFIISILSIILSLEIAFVALDQNIIIELNGKKEITLALNEEYLEEGAKAKICNILKCHKIDKIEIENNVDTNIIGNYEIKYTVKSLNKTKTIIRNILVVDNVKPKIELSGEKSITICPNSSYTEDGFTANDNYDGDLTEKVTIKESGNLLEYKVQDSSNNETTETREIIKIDNTGPVISLRGNRTVYVDTGSTYTDPGATVNDECDGDLTRNLEISNNVNSNIEGKYNVFYKVKDNSGNTATANRTVIVRTPITKLMNETNDLNEYIKYLEQYIKENNYNVSIGYVNIATGYTYKYNEGTIYYGASLAKTVTAMYIVENNLFNDSNKERVKKAIEVSDNSAYKSLVNEFGIDNIRNYGRNIGAVNFLTRSDEFGNTTVNDQIAIWKHLNNLINTHPNGQELKSYFINTYSNRLLFDGIPTTMHKYGYYGNFYHEAGIVFSNKPYIIVILTKHGTNNYAGVIKDLSAKIYRLNSHN